MVELVSSIGIRKFNGNYLHRKYLHFQWKWSEWFWSGNTIVSDGSIPSFRLENMHSSNMVLVVWPHGIFSPDNTMIQKYIYVGRHTYMRAKR